MYTSIKLSFPSKEEIDEHVTSSEVLIPDDTISFNTNYITDVVSDRISMKRFS